jgi:hypothetical protein
VQITDLLQIVNETASLNAASARDGVGGVGRTHRPRGRAMSGGRHPTQRQWRAG